MDSEAEQIRQRLEELPVRANKRRYTAAVKQAVLEFIARRVDGGVSEAAACKAIGMHQATVSEWRNGPRRRAAAARDAKPITRVREVEVEVEAMPKPRAQPLTLMLPGGARVEGLELAQVIALAKALG